MGCAMLSEPPDAPNDTLGLIYISQALGSSVVGLMRTILTVVICASV